MIDPGHGGNDPGAIGNNLWEKDITLAIGLYLEEYLKNDLNYTPFTPPRAAVFLSVDARWQTANNLEADLLLSIHMNSAVGEAGDGFECYPQVPGETYHTKSLQFARFMATGISDIQNLRGWTACGMSTSKAAILLLPRAMPV